jgi:hypothetical protein
MISTVREHSEYQSIALARALDSAMWWSLTLALSGGTIDRRRWQSGFRAGNPLCGRLQLPPHPRMAEGSFAPLPDRHPAPLHQHITAKSNLLTDG